MDQEAYRQLLISNSEIPGEIACLLCNLCRRRVRRATGNMYSARAKLDEEQDIERLQAYGFDGQEITGYRLFSVMPKKGAPRVVSELRTGLVLKVFIGYPNTELNNLDKEC